MSPQQQLLYASMVHAATDEINELANRKYNALSKLILEKVVKPYCDANRMSYFYCNGTWWFTEANGRQFDIGDDRREKPGRPDGPEGEGDEWFLDPTDEEKRIRDLLNTEAGYNACIGDYVPCYPDR